MQFDMLSIALEIAEPKVPAAIAMPAATIASSNAYSAAAAPRSSREKPRKNCKSPLMLYFPPKLIHCPNSFPADKAFCGTRDKGLYHMSYTNEICLLPNNYNTLCH